MLKQNDHTDLPIGQLIDERAETERQLAAGHVLDFYLERYPEVHLVKCNACDEPLILEITDPGKINPHHLHGRTVIELSRKYMSTRKRLDGAQGYQCACGNDNRWSKVEHFVTQHGGANIAPHEEHAILQHISATKYRPSVKISGKETIIEGKFTVTRLK